MITCNHCGHDCDTSLGQAFCSECGTELPRPVKSESLAMPEVTRPTLSSTRPLPITIICVGGFIGAFLTIPSALSDAARSIGAWYPPALLLSGAGGFACMVGFWKMRRWAVFTYTSFCTLNLIILFLMGLWNPLLISFPGILAISFPCVIIAIGFWYLPKMR